MLFGKTQTFHHGAGQALAAPAGEGEGVQHDGTDLFIHRAACARGRGRDAIWFCVLSTRLAMSSAWSIAAVLGVNPDAGECRWCYRFAAGRLYGAVDGQFHFICHVVSNGEVHDAGFHQHS